MSSIGRILLPKRIISVLIDVLWLSSLDSRSSKQAWMHYVLREVYKLLSPWTHIVNNDLTPIRSMPLISL